MLVALALLIDIALSEIVPGACDNASAVAAVLSVAEELDADPPANLDVWVILPGAEECNAEGMACYMRAHRGEIDRERTFFVNLDSVSYGDVHYQRSEGAIVNQAMDRRLVELCEEIAEAQRSAAGDDPGTPPARSATPSTPTPCPRSSAASGRSRSSAPSDGVGPPYYHTPEDTPAKVDGEALTRAVRVHARAGAGDRPRRRGGGGRSPSAAPKPARPPPAPRRAGHRV